MKSIRSLPTFMWVSLGAAVLAVALAFAPGNASVALAVPPPVDACTGVADVGPNFNFTSACQNHDNCYDTYGGGSYSLLKEFRRAACDQAFLNDMNAWCNSALLQRQITLTGYSACKARAQLYYQGVRTFGGLFFYQQQVPG